MTVCISKSRKLPNGMVELDISSDERKIGSSLVSRDRGDWSLDYVGLLPQFQGKGLGVKAVRAVIDYLLDRTHSDDPHLKVEVMSKNIARVMLHILGEPSVCGDDVRDYPVKKALTYLPDFTPVEEDGMTPGPGNRIYMSWRLEPPVTKLKPGKPKF